MIFPLFTLIHKDLKVFFRSKISAFTIIIIPLLIILMAGFSFNSNELSNIQIGTFSEKYTDLSNNIIKQFEESNYQQKKYKTLEECIDSIKSKGSEICIQFNKSEKKEEIIFYVDYSRMNLADTLIHKIQRHVNIESTTIGIQKAQNIINLLETTKTNLEKSKIEIQNTKKTAEEIQKTKINFPNTNINSIIDDLENAKNSANNTNTITKLEESINQLENFTKEQTLLEQTINTNTKKQKEIITKINSLIANIEKISTNLKQNNLNTAEEIATPINLKIESIDTTKEKKDYLLPIIISIIALFGGILLSSSFVIKNKKTRAFFRNFMTPTKDFTFIIGTLTTCLIILTIQFILIFIGIKYILHLEVFAMPLETITILLLSFITFIFIGMFIGYLFKSEETIIFASMIFATILMVFSNTIIPIENISSNLLKITSFNPVIVIEQALKKTMLFNLNFKNILNEIIILCSTILIFMGLTYIFRRLTRRNL